MDIVAGPQGSGKSTFFPVADRGYEAFNIDDKRKELNNGSSRDFPPAVQQQARELYEAFIEGHINNGTSFSFEATLAKAITFEQAYRAQQLRFRVHLTYVATELDRCLERVANRVELGGHGQTAAVIRETYAASMQNLERALRLFDVVQIYDSSAQGLLDETLHEAKPQLALEAVVGVVTYLALEPPVWLRAALAGTEYDLD